MKRFVLLIFASVLVLAFADLSAAASPSDVPRMTKEQLKPLIGKSNVIILDDRSASDYNNSREKIKGAIRAEPGGVKGIIDKYPKDKTLVLY